MNSGVSFNSVIFIVLLILKLFELIDISWLTVFCPLIIEAIFSFIVWFVKY